MVIVDPPGAEDSFCQRIVLVPHRAMSWQQNKRIIAWLGGTCLGIALTFALVLNAWVILPFAGLEVVALAAGLYYASWKASYRHVLTLRDNHITIDKGVYKPRRSWTLPRASCQLQVSPAQHDWESRAIVLRCRGQEIELGEFLGVDDVEQVIKLLTAAGLQIVAK